MSKSIRLNTLCAFTCSLGVVQTTALADGRSVDPQLLTYTLGYVHDLDLPSALLVNQISTSYSWQEIEHVDGVHVIAGSGPYFVLVEPSTGGRIRSFEPEPANPSDGPWLSNTHSLEYIDGSLYGIFDLYFHPGSACYLATVDLLAQTITPIAPVDLDGFWGGFASNGINSYVIIGEGNVLYSIDIQTGATENVGQIVNATTDEQLSMTTLEYGADGLLYAISDSANLPQSLYVIDPATARATYVAELPSVYFGGDTWVGIKAMSSYSSSSCAADINEDGSRDGTDLGLLLAHWGSPGPTDLDNDGDTDGADLGLFLANWGPCP